MKKTRSQKSRDTVPLKVHKREDFLGSDFEFLSFSKILRLRKFFFFIGQFFWGEIGLFCVN
jgi:hypothetical protein